MMTLSSLAAYTSICSFIYIDINISLWVSIYINIYSEGPQVDFLSRFGFHESQDLFQHAVIVRTIIK